MAGIRNTSWDWGHLKCVLIVLPGSIIRYMKKTSGKVQMSLIIRAPVENAKDVGLYSVRDGKPLWYLSCGMTCVHFRMITFKTG